jgi:SAM-dependent methyltransferase
MALPVEDFMQRQRSTWASGDWPSVAQLVQPVADRLVEEAEIQPGARVLDIAAGTGNVAIRAAEKGGDVVASDLVSDFFEPGARRAEEAGVEIEWVEADAQDLPFEDQSFDRVLSTFGVMFAPRHDIAAAELVRVCRPDGLIGLCSWTPDGGGGRMFKTIGSYMPPPPDYAQPPPMWGTEDHVRELLGDRCEIDMERRNARLEGASVEEYANWFCDNFGPLVTAKGVLGDRFEELKGNLLEIWREENLVADGFRFEQEYLRVLARPR